AGLLDFIGRRLAHFGDCQCRHLIDRLVRGDRWRPNTVSFTTREIAQGLFNAAFDLPQMMERELCAHETLLGVSQRKWLEVSSRGQVRAGKICVRDIPDLHNPRSWPTWAARRAEVRQ